MIKIKITQEKTREGEEEVVDEGVDETDFGGPGVIQPLPGPNRRAHGGKNQHNAPTDC